MVRRKEAVLLYKLYCGYKQPCMINNNWGLKAMSHDATSFMGLGFMKPVKPCDRAKTCCKGL